MYSKWHWSTTRSMSSKVKLNIIFCMTGVVFYFFLFLFFFKFGFKTTRSYLISLALSMSNSSNQNKRTRLHKNKVQYPKAHLGAPTCMAVVPLFRDTNILPWRRVKTLYWWLKSIPLTETVTSNAKIAFFTLYFFSETILALRISQLCFTELITY